MSNTTVIRTGGAGVVAKPSGTMRMFSGGSPEVRSYSFSAANNSNSSFIARTGTDHIYVSLATYTLGSPYLGNAVIYDAESLTPRSLNFSGAMSASPSGDCSNMFTYVSGQSKFYFLNNSGSDKNIYPISLSGTTLTIESGSKFEWGTTFSSATGQYMAMTADDSVLYAIDLQNDEMRAYTFGSGWGSLLAAPTSLAQQEYYASFFKSGSYLYLIRTNSSSGAVTIEQYDIVGDSWTTLACDIVISGNQSRLSVSADYDDDSYFFLMGEDYWLYKYDTGTETYQKITKTRSNTYQWFADQYASGPAVMDISNKEVFIKSRQEAQSATMIVDASFWINPVVSYTGSGTLTGLAFSAVWNGYFLRNNPYAVARVVIDGSESLINVGSLTPAAASQNLDLTFSSSLEVTFYARYYTDLVEVVYFTN